MRNKVYLKSLSLAFIFSSGFSSILNSLPTHQFLDAVHNFPCVWENKIGDDFVDDLRLFKLL